MRQKHFGIRLFLANGSKLFKNQVSSGILGIKISMREISLERIAHSRLDQQNHRGRIESVSFPGEHKAKTKCKLIRSIRRSGVYKTTNTIRN